MTVRKDEIHVATLRELAEARAEIARLTAERDQAVTHRAATNKEIKRLHAVIKSKGFSVEDSIALHETRSEIARLTAELAAARAVPGDVEAAIEAHEAAICWLCQNDPVRAGHGATIRTAIARAISEAADARGTVGGQAGPVGKLLGSHAIVEWYLAPDWYQARIGQDGYGMVRRADLRRRHENARTWSSWGQPWGDPAQHMDQPARLVTADQADLDPATRCPLPKGG